MRSTAADRSSVSPSWSAMYDTARMLPTWSGRRSRGFSRSRCPVDDGVRIGTHRRLEVGPDGVGERAEAGLLHLVERDADDVGDRPAPSSARTVVHAVPMPRARAASMKLHIAGRTLAIIERRRIIADAGHRSRPAAEQAITRAGAWPIVSHARCRQSWSHGPVAPVRPRPPSGSNPAYMPSMFRYMSKHLASRSRRSRPRFRIVLHDHELHRHVVRPRRGLHRDAHAVADVVVVDRTGRSRGACARREWWSGVRRWSDRVGDMRRTVDR